MITHLPARWDHVVDVAVVGSGGAALVAATLAHDGGAEVVVLEQAGMIGGTTAVSGGVAWLPGNHHGAASGIADSRDDVLAYLRRLAAGREHDPSLLEVFVDTAPEVLRYLEDRTPVRTQVVPNFPDYYFAYDVPGKRHGGRSVEPVPYAVGTELPEWRDRLVTRGTLMSLGAATTLGEDFTAPDDALLAELARREAEDVRTKGAALVAMLFKGLLERGVDTWIETPARELVVVDGTVVGLRVERDGRDVLIGARKGVVLACGGFEWNAELVRTYIGYPVQPLSPGGNVGDGLVMALESGAELANMGSYWGQPAMFDPAIERDGVLVPQFEWGRGEPSSLIVNQQGERFANEAMPYNDFPKAFGVYDATTATFPNQPPGWMVFDQKVRDSARILSMVPGGPTPDWVPVADTIEELAERIGVDAKALGTTVHQFNEDAEHGVDRAFNRTQVGLMAPGRVAPLDTAPFYAVVIHPGALGTNGGPRLTADAQVRRQRGGVVPGLYAAGNTAASAFGWAYPGGGATIGQGMVFGYRAGRHVAAQEPRARGEPARGGRRRGTPSAMDVAALLQELYGRIPPLAREAIEGVDAERLVEAPADGANPIAWLVWHVARVLDAEVSELIGEPQLWEAGDWAAGFGLDPDPTNSGYGHEPADVAAVRPTGPDVLLGYLDAAMDRTTGYLAGLTGASLDGIVDRSYDPPVTLGVRLVSIVDDCLQHLGQAGYVRGLLGA